MTTLGQEESQLCDIPRTKRPLHVQEVLPAQRSVDLSEILDRLNQAPVVTPFDQSRTEFIADLSRRLARAGRGLAETQALAYWMRKAEIHRMNVAFSKLESEGFVLMPRGTVFHIPPSNVDTLFVYSWVLSTLVGNRNIVRLSSRATEQSNLIIETICEALVNHRTVADSSVMVTYGHDDSVTAAISAVSDTRVIWGGDVTVNRIRSIPIPPHATEVVFADRFSMAAIGIEAYQSLDTRERGRLADLFFNDAYWFDQLGCSSPRLLLWVGKRDPGPSANDFFSRVRGVAHAKAYSVDTSTAIAKLGQSYSTMIDAEVSGYSAQDNTLTVLDMSSFPDVRGEFCGAGLFYQLHVSQLNEIVSHVRRADQTLTTFGIPEQEITKLVSDLRGRGIDRIVPFGQALRFSRFWDGYDLLTELTRKVTISVRGALG
ncbi:acyl-CoA reductase [uncultured Thiodictyon sp.]|uniref:acyl-CoA reductase n=1 Tax=uncultured Thiodictyon sp. TaxID=1846217 RepID=UPI0025CB92BF|nr:acyl-CoA reductase [uncultured Thiodictyon sp.]